jgi:hypothetical protein
MLRSNITESKILLLLHDTKVKALQLFNACHEDKHNRNVKGTVQPQTHLKFL